MAAAVVNKRDLSSDQESAVSQQSTETRISDEATENSSEQTEEVVATLDGLNDWMKNLKGFATKGLNFLEKWQLKHCEIQSLQEACSRLKDACQSCEQQDRLILAGGGNVGKSTIANALLDTPRFWPTACYCMTSRICEAHYDAAADGKPVPKDLVHKSATSEREEFQQPLEVPNPSPFLKPGVILVDLPGLDQEDEYMERLDEYMKAHSADSVALFYVIDVNNKIRVPDRDFFRKLIKPPWQSLSQNLVLMVNKCDLGSTGNGVTSDEEVPDYAKLIDDITREAQNYCTPKVISISMKDKKMNHPSALSKWEEVEAKACVAIRQLKCKRFIKVLVSLEKATHVLECVMKNDQELRAELDHRRSCLDKAEAVVERLKAGKDQRVANRAAEIRSVLVEKQEEHLQALLRTNVPNHWMSPGNLKMFREDVCQIIQDMVANDIQRSAATSDEVSVVMRVLAVASAVAAVGAMTTELASSLGLLAATGWCPPALAVGGVVVGAACLKWLVSIVRDGAMVDEGYVKRLFADLYTEVIKTQPSEAAEAEYVSIWNQAKEAMTEQQNLSRLLEKEAGLHCLDANFKDECSQLLQELAILPKLCKQGLVHWID